MPKIEELEEQIDALQYACAQVGPIPMMPDSKEYKYRATLNEMHLRLLIQKRQLTKV